MEVARAGDEEAEPVGQGLAVEALQAEVVAVVDLQAREPGGAISSMTWSLTVRPRRLANGWAITGTPPAARTSRTARIASGA